jgi:hypothetical protein
MNRQTTWTPEVVRRLTGDFEPWLSCDDCFNEADQWVESLVLHGATLSEPFRAHLRGCQVCLEESESLAELVAADNGIDPALARTRLGNEITAVDAHKSNPLALLYRRARRIFRR